jgi:hypothetical protein
MSAWQISTYSILITYYEGSCDNVTTSTNNETSSQDAKTIPTASIASETNWPKENKRL